MTKIISYTSFLLIILVIFHGNCSLLNAHVMPLPAAGAKPVRPLPAAVGAKPAAGGAAAAVVAGGAVIDITKYGAKPGCDIVQALTKAWNEACISPATDKVLIPKGDFLMGPVTLKGPCKGPIELAVVGNVKGPADPAAYKGFDSMITIEYVKELTITGARSDGGGIFDGQGQIAWKNNNCDKSNECKKLPYNFRFNFITDSVITGITSLNSKLFHMSIIGCNNVTLQGMKIYAEPQSINTDGIHLGRSENIRILNTDIDTGDDCVSVGDGIRQLHVENVVCGRGHGLSVGSLGKLDTDQDISGVFFKNCTVRNADNGVRVKTWLASFACVAEDLHFEDITVENVTTPILVDQSYCPYHNCKKLPSKVKLNKISFKNVRGMGSSPVAVRLVGSSAVPCQEIELADIDLKYKGPEPIVSECCNIKPKTSGVINPPLCTKPANELASAAP